MVGKLNDLRGAYRRSVMTALIDAMLEYGAALRIPPEQFLTVAARRATLRKIRSIPATTSGRRRCR